VDSLFSGQQDFHPFSFLINPAPHTTHAKLQERVTIRERDNKERETTREDGEKLQEREGRNDKERDYKRREGN
jgi:hypothetical protein